MVFVREGTPLPEALRLESEPYISGWRLVTNFDRDKLSRTIQGTKWKFFSLAGHIRATVLGSEKPNVVRRAVRQMLTKLKSERFNSLEITGIVAKRFLGVPYVTVSGGSRHFQESVFLFHAGAIQEWDRTSRADA
jgi:hypothetical protein